VKKTCLVRNWERRGNEEGPALILRDDTSCFLDNLQVGPHPSRDRYKFYGRKGKCRISRGMQSQSSELSYCHYVNEPKGTSVLVQPSNCHGSLHCAENRMRRSCLTNVDFPEIVVLPQQILSIN